jgi:DNA-binding transcriptional ArsR family regulator
MGPPLTKVLFHPRRARILESLVEGAATPAQISERIGQGTGQVAYHLAVLSETGCIRPIEANGEGAERAYEAAPAATRARARP